MTALLYVQQDGTLLVQSDHPAYNQVRYMLLSFAVLKKRIDPIHVYEIRNVTLWQAASIGVSARELLGFLRRYAAHPIPFALQQLIVEEMRKWGLVVLQSGGKDRVVLRADAKVLGVIKKHPDMKSLALELQDEGIIFRQRDRADVKRILSRAGYPVVDKAGYQSAPSLRMSLAEHTELRDYQAAAVRRFFNHSQDESGIVVLPCGAGKTVVGIGILSRLQMHALILTPGESSALQWERELLTRTSLDASEVSLYSPGKPLTPVTITTYQRVTARNRSGARRHLTALTSYPWGIVIYDEVHMLPAPLFRLAADLQGARRLGLSATLIREDGAETDVFSLIGPKFYEVPWKQLEQAGFLSRVRCVEVKVEMDAQDASRYSEATPQKRHRIASDNPNKARVVESIVRRHPRDVILVIGHYLEPLADIAERLSCPLVTGKTPAEEREYWLSRVRSGETRVIVLSRIANMAVDLPNASVAIQVSGLFGSRQEEAQRLGRLLRPDTAEGVFYSLVSRGTVEESMAKHRQMYLVEQGYAYDSVDADDLDMERMYGHETVRMSEHS